MNRWLMIGLIIVAVIIVIIVANKMMKKRAAKNDPSTATTTDTNGAERTLTFDELLQALDSTELTAAQQEQIILAANSTNVEADTEQETEEEPQLELAI